MNRRRHHADSKALGEVLDELNVRRVDVFKGADGAEVTLYAVGDRGELLLVLDNPQPRGGWSLFTDLAGDTLRIDDTVAALRAWAAGERPCGLAQTPD